MTNRQVLLIIAAFIALTLGSFIWYIATWDSRKDGDQTTLIILPTGLRPFAAETVHWTVSGTPLTPPPEAPALATGTML